MNQTHIQQRILRAISRHAEELTDAEVVIDRAFFIDLEKALAKAYLAEGFDRTALNILHSTINQLRADWSLSENSPENRGTMPAAV
jgi:hypothetical protein